jgi:hypothetical protein
MFDDLLAAIYAIGAYKALTFLYVQIL